MRYSRKSRSSGLSSPSSRFREDKDQPCGKGVVLFLTALVFMIVCLQLYYIGDNQDWRSIVNYGWKFLLVGLLAFAGYCLYRIYEKTTQGRELRMTSMISPHQYETMIRQTTRRQLGKLEKDPRSLKASQKIRKSSVQSQGRESRCVGDMQQEDSQFYRELEQMESEFDFSNQD